MSSSHPVFGTFSRPQIVGSISSLESLPPADQFSQECDIVEFRLDALLQEISSELKRHIEKIAQHLPVLITARAKSEGGAQELSADQRSALLKKFATHASLFDIEISSATDMRAVKEELQSQGLISVLSAHNFQQTPAPSVIRELIGKAKLHNADIAKFAVFHHSLADLHSTAHLMQDCFPLPVSVMGMGDLAPVSRVLYAQLGSVLNYGYIGTQATAPGQWPARLLKDAILHSTSLVSQEPS